ncbi:MAG TPA: aminotransferase class I/II-fold pyridoxal phosphate-dependent enzyme [Candidatus Bathyarchaeia archaeon]|nr:aminotransferase class I/II-fold pyridoxal phosphate-dependent enzyme [Candidatus Bathyarchaeia archaeon]
MTGDSTRSVHETEEPDKETGSIIPPIYESTTFKFNDASLIPPAMAGEHGYVYSRRENPTVVKLEEKIASLEHGEAAAAFGSGMAAISTSVLAFLKKGDHVVGIRDLYGGTYNLLHEQLPNLGLETTLVETTDLAALEKATKKNTRIVYIESPTNPTIKLVDIAKAASIAHTAGALLLIDSTFASPINQNPLTVGADLVLHSATKFINGHDDLVAGLAIGSKGHIRKIKILRRDLGGVLDPIPAWLVLRGIKTMALRIRAQNANALALAKYLSGHNKVAKVNYPGLETHPQHALARKQMRGYGGMLSFEIKGDKREAIKLTESLKVASLAASLGGVETLVSQPHNMTHTQMSPEARARAGMPDTLIRVSVGIEDIEDLIADFTQALARI